MVVCRSLMPLCFSILTCFTSSKLQVSILWSNQCINKLHRRLTEPKKNALFWRCSWIFFITVQTASSQTTISLYLSVLVKNVDISLCNGKGTSTKTSLQALLARLLPESLILFSKWTAWGGDKGGDIFYKTVENFNLSSLNTFLLEAGHTQKMKGRWGTAVSLPSHNTKLAPNPMLSTCMLTTKKQI